MLNILLVEPNYPATLLPYGLQKIAGYHLAKKDKVIYTKGNNRLGYTKEFNCPDVIYITSLFTYHGKDVIETVNFYKKIYPKAHIKVGGLFATLMWAFLCSETGIKAHKGILDCVENSIPDFSVFEKFDKKDKRLYKNILFTTRGCVRKCDFCAVKTAEPKYYILDNWKRQLKVGLENNKKSKEVIIQDNNFIASSWKHQQEVVNYMYKLLGDKYLIDFNSGMDCRLFKEKHAKLLSKLNLSCLRFAFDNVETEDGYIQRAIEIAKKYWYPSKIRVFVLYNFIDSPEDFYYRIKELNKMRTKAYPMMFSTLNSVDRNYVGVNWNKELLNNFYNYLVKISGCSMIIFYPNIEMFNKKVGRNAEDFVDNIMSYKTKKEEKDIEVSKWGLYK